MSFPQSNSLLVKFTLRTTTGVRVFSFQAQDAMKDAVAAAKLAAPLENDDARVRFTESGQRDHTDTPTFSTNLAKIMIVKGSVAALARTPESIGRSR
jgi:hypothetical protein